MLCDGEMVAASLLKYVMPHEKKKWNTKVLGKRETIKQALVVK